MVRRMIGGTSAFLALVVFITGTALAQGSTWAGTSLAQMVESARWRIGLLRINGALAITNAGYDADVYYGYLDEPVPDFTLSAGIPVQVLIPLSGNLVVDITDQPQYLFFLDTERERAWNNRFRGQVHLALEKVYFQAGGGLSDVRNRLSPELDVQIREKTDDISGLVLWQASRSMSLALLYGSSVHDFRDEEFAGTDIAAALNRKENVFDFATYHQPNPRIRFFLSGQYGTYDFTAENDEGASRDAESYGILGGFDLIPREGELVEAAGIEGSLSLGYIRMDMKDPLFTDGSGLSGTVDLSVEVMRRTRLHGFFSRGFQFSVYSGASFYFATVYGGGFTRDLSRRAYLRYDLSFGRLDYPINEMNGNAPQGFYSRYMTHTGSLEFRLTRHLGLTFIATLGRRVLEETGLRQDRNFFGINLIYGSLPVRVSAPVRGTNR